MYNPRGNAGGVGAALDTAVLEQDAAVNRTPEYHAARVVHGVAGWQQVRLIGAVCHCEARKAVGGLVSSVRRADKYLWRSQLVAHADNIRGHLILVILRPHSNGQT